MSRVEKIQLGGELSTHLNKRLNRLTIAKFFGLLYRVNMGRMLLTNLLIVLCCIPAYYLYMVAATEVYTLTAYLPTYGAFSLSSGVWTDVSTYISTGSFDIYQSYVWFFALTGLTLTFVLSGVLAIIRDAFWTGSMKVFSSFGKGVSANILYAFFSSVIICAMGAGLVLFNWYIYPTMATWLATIVMIALCLSAVFIVIYLLILCSVTVTYKQTLSRNLADSWHLYMLNIVPNVYHFLIAILPILLFLVLSSVFGAFLIAVMLLVGMFYIPFVWQTHMMRTFSLFHPVAQITKGEARKALSA